jgi:hypothetical protein
MKDGDVLHEVDAIVRFCIRERAPSHLVTSRLGMDSPMSTALAASAPSTSNKDNTLTPCRASRWRARRPARSGERHRDGGGRHQLLLQLLNLGSVVVDHRRVELVEIDKAVDFGARIPKHHSRVRRLRFGDHEQ